MTKFHVNLVAADGIHKPLGHASAGSLVLPDSTVAAYIMEDASLNDIFKVNTGASGANVLVFGIANATANAFVLESYAGDDYIDISTNSSPPVFSFGNAVGNPSYRFLGSGHIEFGGSAGTSGQQLTSNGTNAAPTWQDAGGLPHVMAASGSNPIIQSNGGGTNILEVNTTTETVTIDDGGDGYDLVITNGGFTVNGDSIVQNGNLGINITPQSDLHVSQDGNAPASALLAFPTDEIVVVSKQAGTVGGVAVVASSTSTDHRPQWKGVRARGTLAAPTIVADDDIVMSYIGSGYDGTAIQATASVEFYVDGTPAAGTVPQRIEFRTGTTNTASRTTRAVIKADGKTGVGIEEPSAVLHVSEDGLIPAPALVDAEVDLILSQEDDNVSQSIIVASNVATDRAGLKGVRSRGTLATPTSVADDDLVLSILGIPYDGTANRATASIAFFMDGAVSSGNAPQRIEFRTGQTVSRTTRMIIDSAGNVSIPTDSVNFSLGAGADLSMTHNGTNTTITSITGDLIVDNTNATGLTIMRLGTNDANTAFQVRSDDDSIRFEVTGASSSINANVPINASSGFNINADNQTLTIGASADDSITHDGTNTTWTHTGPAGSDLKFDNTGTTSETWMILGTDTGATAFQVRNNSLAVGFEVDGNRNAFFTLGNASSAFFIQDTSARRFIDIDVGGAPQLVIGNTSNNPPLIMQGSGTWTMTMGTVDWDPTGSWTVDMDASQTVTFTIADNLTSSFRIQEGANNYLDFSTNNGTEFITLGNSTNTLMGMDIAAVSSIRLFTDSLVLHPTGGTMAIDTDVSVPIEIGASNASRVVDLVDRWLKTHSAFALSEERSVTSGIQTTDATPTNVATVGIVDNSGTWIEAHVTGRDTANTEYAYYVVRAQVTRASAGAAALSGSAVTTIVNETTGTMDATIGVSGNNAVVTVTGVAATTINWTCTVRYQAASGNT